MCGSMTILPTSLFVGPWCHLELQAAGKSGWQRTVPGQRPPLLHSVQGEVLALSHRALRHPSASSSLPPPPPRLPPVPGCSALTPSLGPWLCFCLECSGRQLITSGTHPWLPAPSHPESLITRRNLKPSRSPYHPIELQETKATVRRTHCVSPGPGAAPGR